MGRLTLTTALVMLLGSGPLSAAPLFDQPSYLRQLPEQTYSLLNRCFNDFYRATDFTPTISNSYFSRPDLYNFVALPLAITARNGFQFEVFGQLYSLAAQSYVHMSEDQSLYGTIRADLMGSRRDQVAVGTGIGYPLTPTLSLKALLSTNQIPGYGTANYAVGMVWRF